MSHYYEDVRALVWEMVDDQKIKCDMSLLEPYVRNATSAMEAMARAMADVARSSELFPQLKLPGDPPEEEVGSLPWDGFPLGEPDD